MKPQRKIIEELLIEFINQSLLDDKFEELGVKMNHFEFEQLYHWALDIIGFPEDTTLDIDDEINPYSFCRDYLVDPLFEINKEAEIYLAVSNYIDWLYLEYDKYLQENPLSESTLLN